MVAVRVQDKTDSKNKQPTELNQDLANIKCQKAIRSFLEDDSKDVTQLMILSVDRKGNLSSIYCNFNPLMRLWVLGIAWLNELFDLKGKPDA